MLHTLIDGASVQLEAPADLSLPPTSFARWTVAGNRFEFGAGKPEFADSFARGLGLSNYDADLTFEGGRLQAGTDTVLDETTRWSASRSWVVWRGRHYSFFTQRINVPMDELIQVVASFEVHEESAGVVLIPRSDSVVSAAGSGVPCLYKGINGIGLMSIWSSGGAGTPVVPKWRGQKVRGGDLYQSGTTELESGAVQHTLLLVGTSTVISLDVALGSSEAQVTHCMSNLVAEWKATA